MTELTHGSNVRALMTTATYDPATKEFVINSPGEHAMKWWIGNTACTCHACCVVLCCVVLCCAVCAVCAVMCAG